MNKILEPHTTGTPVAMINFPKSDTNEEYTHDQPFTYIFGDLALPRVSLDLAPGNDAINHVLFDMPPFQEPNSVEGLRMFSAW